MTEGCLSLPKTFVYVRRNHAIEVQGYDFQGQKQTYQVQGLWARVIQHEIDHLEGRLIIDYQ
jgi:peptide deformylase